ncbi:hypothetical protein B5F76_07310 [Desulfovibrio sp. An276]|uniref:hypothetical protein n=1 Tax=Desulfovibrio sp. An276 TaxID=1965618 RepID=UPI000B395004|nr:hypothetical protein [Desulfovibrio sp. An276]OUO52458.1 hypothetical protein B5F76_07310 [Desulfovibrio sp. An276]
MQNLKKVTLSYHRVKGLQPRVAHGVYGGVSGPDTVEMEFFSQSENYDRDLDMSLDESGHAPTDELVAGDELNTNIVRTIHTRIYMNKTAAREMVDWLLDVLENMDNMDKAMENDDMLDGIDKSLIYSKTKQ